MTHHVLDATGRASRWTEIFGTPCRLTYGNPCKFSMVNEARRAVCLWGRSRAPKEWGSRDTNSHHCAHFMRSHTVWSVSGWFVNI